MAEDFPAPSAKSFLLIFAISASSCLVLAGPRAVDAEDARGQLGALRNQPSDLRREEARAGVAEGPVGLEAVQISRADAAGYAVHLVDYQDGDS